MHIPVAAAARTASRPVGRRMASASLISRAVVLACLLALGCPPINGPDPGPASQSNYPPASVYDIDPQFAGEWVGDVDGLSGTLKLGEDSTSAGDERCSGGGRPHPLTCALEKGDTHLLLKA